MADGVSQAFHTSKSKPMHLNVKEAYSQSLESDEDYSSSDLSNSSEEDEPRWQEEALKSGELFYVEENDEEQTFSSRKNVVKGLGVGTSNLSNQQIYRNAMPKPVLPPKVNYSKTVFVDVNSSEAYLQEASTNLLSSMLGIIVLNASSSHPSFGSVKDEQITVDVLVPGSICLSSGQVDIGDVLTAVNDIPVTLNNIENVLLKINKPLTIKLTFDVFENLQLDLDHKLSPISLDVTSPLESHPCIVNVLTPHLSRQSKAYSLSEHHSVFYMTLKVQSETAAEFDDLLYSFPTVEAAITPSKLAQIRGLFLTLSDLMKDSFSTLVLSTTLVAGEETVHCAYYQVETEVLVICLPSTTYSLAQVHVAASNAVRLLSFMYGDLITAFQPENKQRLDHFFRCFLFLNGSSINNQPTSPNGTPGVHQLTLPKQLQHQAHSSLAELEASDFDLGTKALNFSRRLYTVRGSCLFYDGHLVATHLPKEDLKDVFLFCYNHNLLAVREKDRIGLLVIWREIFRWCFKIPKKKDDFVESEGRHFLLIVGLKRSLLCTLLQLNGQLFPSTHTPRPDTSFVDSVKAILLNLEVNQFFERVQSCLVRPSSIQLTTADGFLSKSAVTPGKPPLNETRQSSSRFKLRLSSPLRFRSNASDSDDGRTPTKAKSDDRSFSTRVSRSLFRDRSFSSQDSIDGGNSPKTPIRTRTLPPSEDIGSRMEDLVLENPPPQITLTAGSSNSLFSYVEFDHFRGVVISPTQGLPHGGEGFPDIIHHFHKQVLLIHQRLAARNPDGDHCVEEGVLFQYWPSKGHETKKKFLQYWVVGRKMRKPHPHELYVCFHNSAPQSMVELAFKSADFL